MALRWLLAIGVTTALIAGVGGASAADSRAVNPYKDAQVRVPFAALPAEPKADPAATATVTLVTGERFRVEPGADGRPNAVALSSGGSPLIQFTWAGDQYAVPADAVPYLDSKLDLRLFNVGYLVRAKLDDAHTRTLPVKVEGTGVPARPATKDARRIGDLLKDGKLTRITLAPPEGAPQPPAAPEPVVTPRAGVRYHTITVDPVNRDGEHVGAFGFVQNVADTGLALIPLYSFQPEKNTFSVPEGTYSIVVFVTTPAAGDRPSTTALVAKPELSVTADQKVSLDARAAVPFAPVIDGPPASTQGMTRYDRMRAYRGSRAGTGRTLAGEFIPSATEIWTSTASTEDAPRLFATPTDRVTKGVFGFSAARSLAEPAGGDPAARPKYHLVFPYTGRVPAAFPERVAGGRLTTVRSTVHDIPVAPGGEHWFEPFVYLPWTGFSGGIGREIVIGDNVEYWYSSAPDLTLWQRYSTSLNVRGDRRRIRPGQEIREVWNKAPYGPSRAAPFLTWPAAGPEARVCVACRQGDLGLTYIKGHSDSDPSHYGNHSPPSTTMEFRRDGRLVFTSSSRRSDGPLPVRLDLPLLPKPAGYRLTLREAGTAGSGASGTTDWTFRSGPGDPAARLPQTIKCVPDASRPCSFLPLLFVGYDLPLDIRSQAKADAPFEIVFDVGHQQGQSPPSGVAATVAVSYDDGKTWSDDQPATRGPDGRFTATIRHPAGAGQFVSLRVKAHDNGGNAVEQTNIRAYRLTG